MIAAGMDIGARTIKVVLLSEKGVLAKVKMLPGLDPGEAAEKALQEALQKAGLTLSDLGAMVATGIGCSLAPHATAHVTEPMADARGVNLLFPNVRTVVDVGAEEGRGIRINEQGQVLDCAVNEKCAAGSGAFMEAMARALEVDVAEFGRISLQATQAVPMNAQCTVFAESEVVSLIHANTSKADISRAVHDATASRVAAMTRRVGLEKELALIGGVARNVGFVDSLKRTLGLDNLLIPKDPDYVGALGAALIAAEQHISSKQKEGGKPIHVSH